jgi:biotin carboxyl carrier protein
MEDKKPKYHVFVVNSGRYLTLLTKKFENRKNWQPLDPNEIRSFIPGTILDVYVKPDQEVKEGQPLLMIESMKMQTKIEMPVDGIIKEVNIKKGDKVPKNMVMIVIE